MAVNLPDDTAKRVLIAALICATCAAMAELSNALQRRAENKEDLPPRDRDHHIDHDPDDEPRIRW